MALFSPLLLIDPVSRLKVLDKLSFGIGPGRGGISDWLQAFQIIGDHPVFVASISTPVAGAGPCHDLRWRGASSYGGTGGLLFIMTMTGVVGLVVYCFMLWQVIARCRAIWRDRASTPSEKGIAIGTASATVAVVVASAFINAILTTFVMEILWVLWALTFVMVRARRDRAAQGPSSPSTIVALVA